MQNNEEFESLKLAIKTEQDGRKMYLDASERVSNPLAKSTLTTLADEELIHIKVIEEFYNDLKEGGEGTISADLEKALSYDLRKKTIFEAAKGRMDAAVVSGPDVFEIYRAAIQFEEDGAKMYQDMAGKTANPLAKKLYDFLNAQENEHYRILSETLHYLENPDQWFVEQEKPHFEG